jgi:hypothetical protein
MDAKVIYCSPCVFYRPVWEHGKIMDVCARVVMREGRAVEWGSETDNAEGACPYFVERFKMNRPVLK